MSCKTILLDYEVSVFSEDTNLVTCGEAGSGRIRRSSADGKVCWEAFNGDGSASLGRFRGPASKLKAISRVVQYVWAIHYMASVIQDEEH